MQEKHLYEYAIVRIVPRVEREEFLNIGVILYSRKPAYLQTVSCINEERLLAVYPAVNLAEVKAHLQAFIDISEAKPGAGPIAQLDMASRFRWLTAKRSTILQTSGVHPGLCNHPAEAIKKLQDQLVDC